MKQPDIRKTKKNMGRMLVLFVTAFAFLIGYFVYSSLTYGQQWFTNAYNPRLASQREKVSTGSILDRNGVVLASSNGEERVYNSDSDIRLGLAHVVGDCYGMTTGAESYFAPYLLGFNTNVFERIYMGLQGEEVRGDDVLLTVDAELSAYAYQLMEGKHGAVVVSNYQTGEVLSSVSLPTFDVNNIEAVQDDSDNSEMGPLVNRATMGRYTPGSIFKTVTALAAIRDNNSMIYEEYTCAGAITINGVRVTCYHDTQHGTLDFEEAYAVSCNKYFAELAVNLGWEKLTEAAESLGFNEDFIISDFILYSSSYSAGESDSDLAFSAIGQYTDTITPMHANMIVSMIANGGTMMEPKLLKEARNSRTTDYTLSSSVFKSTMTQQEAQQLEEMMLECVASGTGRSAAVSGVSVAGKTGTAEVTTDGSKAPHSWFTGYIADDDHPIAITVVVENGGAGSSVATPIAGKILAKAISLGY